MRVSDQPLILIRLTETKDVNRATSRHNFQVCLSGEDDEGWHHHNDKIEEDETSCKDSSEG